MLLAVYIIIGFIIGVSLLIAGESLISKLPDGNPVKTWWRKYVIMDANHLDW